MQIKGDFTIKKGLSEIPRSSSSIHFIQDGIVEVELLGEITTPSGEKEYFGKTTIGPILYCFWKDENIV